MLKARLAEGTLLSVPGVFDPLSARLAEQLGFGVLYMSGYSVSAALLGLPDAGLISYREMVDRVAAITRVTSSPLIADGDTGFGGLANVRQAVREYEHAGAAAIQLEDQEYPKRCGHTRNRRVISKEDMLRKIDIAITSRQSDDFLIIARTDARTEHGLDEALARAEAYRDAGADILFVESPESVAEMRQICAVLAGTPCLANMVAGGSTPVLPDAELGDLGYAIALHPIYLLGAMVSGVSAAGKQLMATGSQDNQVADINVLNGLVDFQSVWDLDGSTQEATT